MLKNNIFSLVKWQQFLVINTFEYNKNIRLITFSTIIFSSKF